MLEEFFDNEENQKKYGFEYIKEASGISSIIYDGDMDALMETAYTALGYVEVERNSDRSSNDTRPTLELAFNVKEGLVRKDTDLPMKVGVDGVGDIPNFFLRFREGDETVTIRFNLVDPELYPENESAGYRFSMQSLSAINELMRYWNGYFEHEWNRLRPEKKVDLEYLPNYRAIAVMQRI